jgi:hypothetical protein
LRLRETPVTPEPGVTIRRKVTIRLPAALVKAAKIRAAEIEQDFQDVVRLALEAYLKPWKGRP